MIFKYAADDRSWDAEQQRKTNRDRQLAAGKLLSEAAAANPTGKPNLDLLKVPKDPESESIFGDLRGILKRDVAEQSKQVSALDALRLDNNAKMLSAVNEDVAKIGNTAEQYAKETRATAAKYDTLINEGRDLGVDLATGGLERARMSRNPYLGWGTANTYDAVQAYAPVFNQAAQRGQEINQAALDRILASERGTIGQRQSLLAGWDTFNRGQLDDRQRLTAGNLANAGAFSRLYNDANFLGVGGQTNNMPYSLPNNISPMRVPSYPRPVNRAALDAVQGDKGDKGDKGGGGGGGGGGTRPRVRSEAEETYKETIGWYPNEDANFSSDPGLQELFKSFGGQIGQPAQIAQADQFPQFKADYTNRARATADRLYESYYGYAPNFDPNYDESAWRNLYNAAMSNP